MNKPAGRTKQERPLTYREKQRIAQRNRAKNRKRVKDLIVTKGEL